MKSSGKFLIILAACWTAIPAFFVRYVFSSDHGRTISCDNVAVLTGERSRIPYALRFVEECKPKNVFISGVHRNTSLKDILPGRQSTNVRVILGKKAKNTRENALEINEWAVQNKISEIVLVTSDYHMPRSIAELKRINKRLKIHPRPVKSELNFKFIRQCVKVFHKMIFVCVKAWLW
jgi:uncharacterized SAM-binding protein YcdF (DUF218 family)